MRLSNSIIIVLNNITIPNTIYHENILSELAKNFVTKAFCIFKVFRVKLIKLHIIVFNDSSVIDKSAVFYYIFISKVVCFLSS